MPHALLIVDIQNDYFPGGTMPLEGSPEAAARAATLLAAFRARGLPVVHVQHIANRAGATFFLPGTKGAEIHELLAPLPGEKLVRKHTPNSFRDTDLLDHLKSIGVEHLVVAGMMTHMCIDATVRAAFDLGFACSLAGDACATRALTIGERSIPADQVHHSFLAALNGLYAKVAPAAESIPAG